MALSAAAAASIVALLTVFMLGQAPWNLFGTPKATPMAVPNEGYVTAIGETRVVHPGDGSAITMNTSSAMVVIYSPRARDVYLLRGEAGVLDRAGHVPARSSCMRASACSKRRRSSFNVRMASPESVELTVSDGRVKVLPAADAVYPPEAPRAEPLVARRESLVYEQEVALVEPHEETVRRLEAAGAGRAPRLAAGHARFSRASRSSRCWPKSRRYTSTDFVLCRRGIAPGPHQRLLSHRRRRRAAHRPAHEPRHRFAP